jgi:hypothetical protein
MAALAAALVLSMSLLAAGVTAKKKLRHVGTSVTVESSAVQKGKRLVVVNAVVQSSEPRCERQRSVLLYEVGPSGDFVGGAIGHAVSQGGNARGEVTVQGEAPKKIKPDRRFRLEVVGRKVKIGGVQMICKRSVSVQFQGDLSTPTVP